ncbi:hypothetical protein [Streptomyces sp. SID3212]|uniref:hypothetical protein n=1 Tax=Streptomyces sp. SID3212 TaxID=2690259 RepID=UPI00136F6CB3|nr:hypothetical protein [Streptomyces sp. SID3212]
MTAHRPHTTRSTLLLAVLALASAAMTTACSADEKDARPTAPRTSEAPAAAPANIEKIAALTGCEADIRTDADELREGVCVTARGSWTVTTFPEEKFKQTWLESAAMYGGTYLVGPRWAIGGKPELLAQLRTKVGGNLQKLRDMNAPLVTPASPSP